MEFERALAAAEGNTDEVEEIRARPIPRPGRWAAAVLVLVLIAMLVHSLIVNPNYGWSVVGDFFTDTTILAGIRITLFLTACGMGIGVVLGVVLAVMRLSDNPVLRYASGVYVWFFRGTPLLVQLIFWYNVGALYPHPSLGIPFGPAFVSGSANSLISPLTAGILGLGLNEAAYMAEIVRGGIASVDQGQTVACRALGMSSFTKMWYVILPQALRAIIPPTGNELINMLKSTALVSVIALADLLYSADLIASRTYQTIPMLIVASIWYLMMTSVLSVIQMLLERRVSRGTEIQPEPRWTTFRRNLRTRHAIAPRGQTSNGDLHG